MSAVATLALSLLAAPVPVQETQIELKQLVASFRSICLERIGDAPGQTGVATAAPWNFTAGSTPTQYDSGPAWLVIQPESQTCAVTAPVPAAETVASVQAALGDIVPPGNWHDLPSADSRYVLVALDDGGTEFVIAFKISNTSGRNLTTLSVAKR